jgi:integrase
VARSRTNGRRARGHIRRRGSSFQVLVYAGTDPLTGKPNYLTESTRDDAQAQKILTRLLAQVDEQRNPRTKATMGAVLDAWLRTHEAEESTLDGYRGYIRRTIEPSLGSVPLAKVTAQVLEEFYADLRRCRHQCRNGEPAVDHRTAGDHECRTIRHKRRPGRPGREVHDCATAGCVVVECAPHRCRPMAASSIRQVHWIISAALAAAVRWEWIRSNPAETAKKPKQRPPQPEPPTVADAARLIAAAWDEDDAWGTLVWVVMVTGMRRGEVLALRWSDVDLDAGMLVIRRNYVRTGSQRIEKDTKTHQMRRIALDPETVAVLADHRSRYHEQVRALGVEPSDQAFIFSYQPLSLSAQPGDHGLWCSWSCRSVVLVVEQYQRGGDDVTEAPGAAPPAAQRLEGRLQHRVGPFTQAAQGAVDGVVGLLVGAQFTAGGFLDRDAQ